MLKYNQFILEVKNPLSGEFDKLNQFVKDKFGYTVIFLNKKPKGYYGKHFYHNKTIEIYTKERTLEQIQSTLDHEIGHIVDYKRRGIVPDPMGDSVMGWDGKLRPAADHDIYFRNDILKKEAELIRKEFPTNHTLSTTQKEIWADAYRIYLREPEKLKRISPNIFKQLDDYLQP